VHVSRILYAAVSAAGVLAATALAVPSAAASASPVPSASTRASTGQGVTLSHNPLGVDVAPWETIDLTASWRLRMDRYIHQLGPWIAVRWGGGVFADADNAVIGRNTNAVTQAGHQTNDFTGPNSRPDALRFPFFAAEDKTIGGNIMVTLNYGTGSPALAGSWLASIYKTHEPVTMVELGNEPYGCSSPDMEITRAPINDTSYEPNVPAHCPYAQAGSGSAGIKWFARSFISHAPAFIAAVRKADPSIQIVLPYAISPPRNSGYIWDHMVMSAIKGIKGLNVLWYPSMTASSPSPATALSWLTQIPVRAAAIRADVRTYAPGAYWMIGEENLDNQPTIAVCQPLTAVFAAGSALSWLAQGAHNVNWWTLSTGNNRNGRCVRRDFSMFDLTGDPQPPYWGFLLASKLAQPRAYLSIVNSGNSEVLEFHSTLANGHQAAAFINISAARSETVAGPAIGSGTLTRLRYASSHAAIVRTLVSSTAVKRITLPLDSVTVFMR
jgi:hypothetical protein